MRTDVHIAHLQTKLYSAHKALDDLYSGILDIADRYAEASQGLTSSILTGYTSSPPFEGEILPHIKASLEKIYAHRASLDPQKEGFLIQIIDDLIELYSSSIYKLTFLK